MIATFSILDSNSSFLKPVSIVLLHPPGTPVPSRLVLVINVALSLNERKFKALNLLDILCKHTKLMPWLYATINLALTV